LRFFTTTRNSHSTPNQIFSFALPLHLQFSLSLRQLRSMSNVH
jgi:hypothetical protein